jgi:hypothetical protein
LREILTVAVLHHPFLFREKNRREYNLSPFAHGSAQFSSTDADMDEIITKGSVAAASCPEFHMQYETLDTVVDMEDVEHDDAKEEVEEEEPVEVEPAAKGRKKKRLSNARPGEPRVKWTPKEDECLAEAWKTVSIDPITGANQNADTYWRRVKMVFDERKMVDLEFSSIHMDHGDKAMANHWATIQQACNKWHGIQEEVMARPESGANIERGARYVHGSPAQLFAVFFADTYSSPVQMLRMFDMYRRDSSDAEFKFLHVFAWIESCEKWTEVWLALAKDKDGVYNPDVPVSGAAEGRPNGNKKAKAVRDSAPAAE